ncbi:MAG: hypothetical protein NUW37_13650 [Planctomycetes bacterium]|nr:hypothetical protein [Planctomycetota bacterium]
MVELRTFVYLDVLQPQLASFLATVSQGYLPVEEQASLYIEIAPGIAINRVTDIACKQTTVEPGMQIVERAFGVLEIHSYDQGQIRQAGEAICNALEILPEDRLKPRIVSDQVITGIEPYQAMLINRMRHGNMILKGQTLYILETHPAGYAIFAANEAEKAANINLLEMRAVGAFGRLYLGGSEADILEARKALIAALESVTGRENRE